MSKKKPLQKERANRSASAKELKFSPFTITAESAHTAILLLESKEPEILCQTLRAITKFQAQGTENREILFDLHAIKYILPHIENPELNIKRFALKALAQQCQLPRGPEQVIGDTSNLRKIAFMLTKMEDIYVLEFASLILAEVTREPEGCEQVITCNILAVLFNRMRTSPDPDVQKNCLSTLSNLLDDPATAADVTKNPQFNWPALLSLMHSKFLAIQHTALQTIDQLVGRYNDVVAQRTFKASTGVLDLCDILESYEFRDIHEEVLGVLHTYVETEENAAHFYASGCILRLLAYLDMAIPAMKPHCIAVLTKLSFTENGRHALFETGTDLVFVHHLLSSDGNLLADTAMGVANMTKLLASAVRMSETNIIDALQAIIGDDSAIWFNVRMNALLAMTKFCKIIPRAAFQVVEPKNFNVLRSIHKKPNVPIEAQRLVVQCFINLLDYEVTTKAMLTADFISELLGLVQQSDIRLKILASNVLTGLMIDEDARNMFTTRKGEMTVSNNLSIEHVGLRTALCLLLVASVTDDGADVYLHLGTLRYMVENKQARYVVSAWEAAIEAIFSHHPSARLAFSGRLDINDFTREGFYVMKRMGDVFLPMEELMSKPPPYEDPVLVAIFLPSPLEMPSNTDIRMPYTQPPTKPSVSRSSSGRIRLPVLVDDPNLRSYLLKLRIWFGDPTKSTHYFEIDDAHYEVRRAQDAKLVAGPTGGDPMTTGIPSDHLERELYGKKCLFLKTCISGNEGSSKNQRYREKCSEVSSSLKQRAQLLAEFVAEQMSGLSQERDCSMPSVEIHLADLMLSLNSRIIGLGFVKCGGALERAILYKVLADRIGLPCSLNRRTSAHAWCEVAVPERDPDEVLDKEESYPAGLLRANYVVDLMDSPGTLYRRASREAQKICGPTCAPMYVARSPPIVCKCTNPNHPSPCKSPEVKAK